MALGVLKSIGLTSTALSVILVSFLYLPVSFIIKKGGLFKDSFPIKTKFQYYKHNVSFYTSISYLNVNFFINFTIKFQKILNFNTSWFLYLLEYNHNILHLIQIIISIGIF